jgi:pimeloyl-ACP methyl ester carboxylesterase
MPFATTHDGARISYRATGDGPPHVLFLHGWAGSARSFDETVAALDTTRAGALAVDLSDHGESGEAVAETTLDTIAAEAIAVADAAGASAFVVVGFSMSAKFALYLASEYPDRVLGQVLVAGCPATPIPLPRDVYDDWMARAGDAGALIEIPRRYATRSMDTAVLDRFGRDAARVPRSALEATLTVCLSTAFAERLGGVQAPTLVVAGAHDAIFAPNVLRDTILAPMPHARMVVLDCGHEIPAEAPEELALLVEAFLAGVAADDEPVAAAAPRPRARAEA